MLQSLMVDVLENVTKLVLFCYKNVIIHDVGIDHISDSSIKHLRLFSSLSYGNCSVTCHFMPQP